MRTNLTMRFILTLIGGASTLLAASRLAAAQGPASKDSTQHVARATHRFSSARFSFELDLPAAMNTDTIAEKTLGPDTIPMAHSWNFLQPPGKGETNGRWQRVAITAMTGVGVNEAEWTRFTSATVSDMLRTAVPEGEVLENAVHWRPDIAEFRLGLHDLRKKEFVRVRCLGSQAGRRLPVLVCVNTGSPTADGLDSVRASLVLTPPQVTNK